MAEKIGLFNINLNEVNLIGEDYSIGTVIFIDESHFNLMNDSGCQLILEETET